jgi:hypothetical protein
VTVHLSERDIKTKTGPTGADGCYLGRDLVRNCEFVYVPSLRRLGSFTATSWLTDSFAICKRITSDTPVEYHQMDDLRFGPATAELLPKQMRASRQVAAMAAKKEGEEAAFHSLAPIALAAKKEGAAVTKAGMVLKKALIDLQAANAKHIEDGVNSLKKEGVTAFTTHYCRSVCRRCGSRLR